MKTSIKRNPAILIVDHSRVVLKLLERITSDYYQDQIITTRTGCEAQKILSENSSIKVIISDLWMPKTDGFRLLKNIQESANQRIKSTPVIIITSHLINTPILDKLSHLGAFGILKKPVNAQKLNLLLADALNSRLRSNTPPLNIVSINKFSNFPVSNSEEVSLRGDKELTISRQYDKKACLITFKIKEPSFHRSETTKAVLDCVQDVLSRNLRESDYFARTDTLEFIYLLNGRQQHALKRRSGEILDKLISKLKTAGLNDVHTKGTCCFIGQDKYARSFGQISEKNHTILKKQAFSTLTDLSYYTDSSDPTFVNELDNENAQLSQQLLSKRVLKIKPE